MPKVKPENINPEALDIIYYLTRRNMIVNIYNRDELDEIRACELLSYLKFVEYTKQPMDMKLINNDRDADVLGELFQMHDKFIKDNFYELIKAETGNTIVRMCCINAIRSLLAVDIFPTIEDVKRFVKCGTKRLAYEEIFKDLGGEPKDLYLSYDSDDYNPNLTMEECRKAWVDKETARYIRSGKFNEEVSRQEAERKWCKMSDIKKQKIFLEFCGVL